MKKQHFIRILAVLSFASMLWWTPTGIVHGQFKQNKDTIKIDPSGFPPAIQKGYRLFATKCNECHGLDTSLKPTMSASQWTAEVNRMQGMPSSQFNDAQAKAIVDFLTYYGANRKSLNKNDDQSAASGSGSAGSQFYDTQGCATCHAISGKGGTTGPALNDVGKRLSKAQLTEVIQKMRTGKSSMPPLPAETTDQQVKDLSDYLASLGGEQQKKEGADKPKEPETGAEKKPADQAATSATGGAGRQFYDAQGCAKCHAIDGKGGNSAPSLSDVGKRLSKEQLTEVIQKIKTGKSSMPQLPAATTDQQVKDLTDYLVTLGGEQQKKDGADKPKELETEAEKKPVDQAAASGAGGAGRQFYDKQGCAKCHAIDGKGGTSAPSLSDVGKRLSKEKLTEVIQKIKTGKSSMPQLPAGTTDQQVKDLTDYLLTLGGDQQKQSAGKPKEPEADKEKKPADQAAAPGAGGAGRQFYDKQGCAKCHAIDGKGGTSAPSLSDVGKRLPKEQLTVVIQKMKAGKSSMPPLPAGTTDQQVKDLVGFLVTLNSGQKNNAGTAKEPETPVSQKSLPLSQQPGQETVNRLAVATNHGAMLLSVTLLLLIAITALLIGVLVFRPGLTATPDGKIMAFFGLLLLPLVCMGMGTAYHIERSKSTKFCLSCHEMEAFGKSLLVDDPAHLPAAHFQNHRVPAGEACFACHTNYAMYGGFREKIQGLKEVYEHYLGNPPAPEAIRLSEPFNNRECLHCHLGARSFEEGVTHNTNPYLLPAVKGNQLSCLSSGCHQTVHNVGELDKVKFWKGKS